tara:strand:+ start:938 stop:1801 length:864 start_codon:yes stop_codon:yes gene_type:complete
MQFDKERRKQYSREYQANKKKEQDLLKRWISENPEAYQKKLADIKAKADKEQARVQDFRDIVGTEYFKAVSVHACPDLMCECGIPETPAMHSPMQRAKQKCHTCDATYSAVFYQVGYESRDQHKCDRWGLFVMSPDQYTSVRQVNGLYSQWSNKVLLSGPGERHNDGRPNGHVTLQWFKPSRALFAVCNYCNEGLDQGYLSFGERVHNSISGQGHYGDSSLVCSKCVSKHYEEDLPFQWEIRDWEIMFFQNTEFNWDNHRKSQRDEIEQNYFKYKQYLDSIDFDDRR